jgi:hypothetical protein
MKDPRFSQNLQRSLADWQCWDVASYWVAVALGVAPDPGEEWDLWGGKKWVFWSSDPLGEGTTRILEMLVEVGALEKKSPEGGDLYRWNAAFDWEKYGGVEKKA